MKTCFLYLSALTLLLGGCESLETDFGNQRVYLTKQMVARQLQSSYYDYVNAPDEDESPTETIHVSGVFRSGVADELPSVRVKMAADKALTEQILAGTIEVPDQVAEALEGCQLLPEECYEIQSLDLVIPEGGAEATIPVVLYKEKIKRIDPFSRWVLPVFRIESASADILETYAWNIVVLDVNRTGEKPNPEPLPDDLTGWTNVVLGKTATGSVWSDQTAHSPQFAIDGNTNIEENSKRWVPFTQSSAQAAPELTVELQGTYRIDGFKLYYCKETNAVRENCAFWIRQTDGKWRKIEELRNTELSNIVSYSLPGVEATAIRVTWDLIKQPTATYFLKLKELEVYQKPL